MTNQYFQFIRGLSVAVIFVGLNIGLTPPVHGQSEDNKKDNSSADSAQADRELSVRERAIREHKQAHGNLTRYFSINGGLLLGARSMDQPKGTLSHSTSLIGFSFRSSALFSLFDGSTQGLGADIGFDYAPFKTRAPESGRELASNFKHFYLNINQLNGLTKHLVLQMTLGTEWTDLFVTENDEYKGDHYVPIVLGFGLRVRLPPRLHVHAGGSLQPMFAARSVPDLINDGVLNLGFGGRTGVEFHLTDLLTVSGEYKLRYYNGDISLFSSEEFVRQTELIHLGRALIGLKW